MYHQHINYHNPANIIFRTPVESSKVTQTKRGDFSLFPNLPAELRLKIWKFALQYKYEPTLKIHSTCGRDKAGHHTYIRELYCNTPSPSLLFVCKEARQEAVAYYNLSFGGLTYFNSDTSVLRIDTVATSGYTGPSIAPLEWFTDRIASADLERVLVLVLRLRDWVGGDVPTFSSAMRKFKNLINLVLVVDGDDPICPLFNRSQTRIEVRRDLKKGIDKLAEPYKVPWVQVFVEPSANSHGAWQSAAVFG